MKKFIQGKYILTSALDQSVSLDIFCWL